MKTLVVSLLRMGDFFSQVPSLRKIKGEVHILLNESVKPAASLFPEFQYHFFPREQLQRMLADKRVNVVSCFKMIEELAANLNQYKFDAIQNWTHTKISAQLIEILDANQKSGLVSQNGNVKPMSPYLSYFNYNWEGSAQPTFHWIDALEKIHFSKNLRTSTPAIKKAKGPIYLQIFTSDVKKNWEQEKWLALAEGLKEIGEDVRILCAPFEVEKLNPSCFVYPIEVLSLSELKLALAESRLLITGDTAVLHLAVALQVPTLSLFIGSANPYKTGPRQIGASVLRPTVGCSPCRHRDPCTQGTHLCAEALSLEEVLTEGVQMLSSVSSQNIHLQNQNAFKVEERSGQVVLLQNRQSFYSQRWGQFVWQVYLGQEHRQKIPPYSSIANEYLTEFGADVNSWIRQIEQDLVKTRQIFSQFEEIAIEDSIQNNLWKMCVEKLRFIWKSQDFFQKLYQTTEVSDAHPFVKMRMQKQALSEANELVEIQFEILRKIKFELQERGQENGTRS